MNYMAQHVDGAEPIGALPVPRATIETIVAKRNKTLTLYGQAFEAWTLSTTAMQRAMAAFTGAPTRFTYHLGSDQRDMFALIKQPSVAEFTKHVRRITDTDVWSHIISLTDLERLMDATAKKQLHAQLIEDPPEVTVDNVHATLEQFILDADTIWKRGIAKCFSELDRRFRSHDGWKVGSRVILDHAFNEHGSWSFYSTKRDVMIDIERTFLVLDGRSPTSVYTGIVEAIEKDRRDGHWGAKQSVTESEFFKVCVYKNGNAHVWFKRDDLVEKVNVLLGAYYDAPIPEEREAKDSGFHARKTAVAKGYAFYPTPDAAAQTVIDAAWLHRRYQDDPILDVLEPSAGTGSLARLCVEKGARVDCIELHAERAEELRASGLYRRVTCSDFLAQEPLRLYDRVVMNPPFDLERDIDHVLHAMKFLKPDGRLVAIMSAGTEFRGTKKATAFRELMASKNASWSDLPAGSFASVGTYCNTVVLSFRADGRAGRW